MPSHIQPKRFWGNGDRKTGLLGLWAFVAIFLILLTTACYLGRLANCGTPGRGLGDFSQAAGDHLSYIGAMENYLASGQYYFTNMHGDVVFAGRMPHYAMPYWLLRHFFNAGVSSDLIVLLHVALLAFAIWLSTTVVVEHTGRRWAGWLFAVIALTCPHLVPWTTLLTPDGSGAALLTIVVILFHRTLAQEALRHMFQCSMALCALIVIKPYYALLVPLVAFAWWWQHRNTRTAARIGLILGVPLLLALAPWWVRNLKYFDHFFPFQQDLYAGYGYSAPELKVRALLIRMGEEPSTWWEPRSLACRLKLDPPLPCSAQWPGYLSKEIKERLVAAEELFLTYQRDPTDRNATLALHGIDGATRAYNHEYPLRTTFLNRPLLVWRFLVNSGSYHLPINSGNPCYSPVQLVPKVLASLGYILSLVGALFGVYTMFRREWVLVVWLVPALYLILLFPGYIGLVEWRYFIGAYLCNLILFVILIARLWRLALDRVATIKGASLTP